MKTAAAVLLASASVATALKQCTGTAKDEGGNWFCGAVNHILYSNVGHPGTYKAVSHMGDDGSCQFQDKPFAGPLAPFNEELAALFRGPLDLKQFAVYNLGGPGKRSVDESSHAHARRHGHQHLHKKAAEEKREEVWVTATIDGKVQSWINNYFGPTPTPEASPAEAPAAPPAPATPSDNTAEEEELKRASPDAKFTKSQKAKQAAAAAGAFTRSAYYNADKQEADGLVFLGNYGGQGSGVFDYKFGNSLSYLNSAGTGGAASPQVLKAGLIPSNKEFAIYSDKPCKNGDCGYYRPGAVGYHGFGGEDKVFLAEYKMPLDGQRTFNGDMPASWLLNARIPRTVQYGDCSCWQSDCGEFDILEVLASGDTKCKSTFHTNVDGGSSDYFERPIDKYIKVATVFDSASGSVSVKIVPDSVAFGPSLTKEQVQSWIKTDKDAGLISLFTLGN